LPTGSCGHLAGFARRNRNSRCDKEFKELQEFKERSRRRVLRHGASAADASPAKRASL
jgi:hypothetical protein